MEPLVKWLSSFSAEQIGATLGAAFLSFLSFVGPKLAKAVTAHFKKTEKEFDKLDDREKERVTSAEIFTRDAEILRLRRQNDSSIRRAQILESHIEVLEAAKEHLEERIAQQRFERATGKHKLPPPIRDITHELESERPKSGAKALPPLPTKPRPTRPK
jgi:predicted Zn-dependent peptidase